MQEQEPPRPDDLAAGKSSCPAATAEFSAIGRLSPHPRFGPSAADQLGLRRRVVYDDAMGATASEPAPRPAAVNRPQR